MKNQALFSSKDVSKQLKCPLLQFLFGALRVNINTLLLLVACKINTSPLSILICLTKLQTEDY